MRRGRAVDFVFGLAADFVAGCLVRKFGHELIGLSIDVGLAWRGFRGLNISREKFFRRLGLLRFQLLGVKLLFVSLEELVWVSARRNDHGCVCTSSEDTFIVHDVLRVILFP